MYMRAVRIATRLRLISNRREQHGQTFVYYRHGVDHFTPIMEAVAKYAYRARTIASEEGRGGPLNRIRATVKDAGAYAQQSSVK